MKKLLLLGHGSSKHPDSSQSVRMHADLLRASGKFSDVRCAFLKEEPFIEGCLAGWENEQVVIIPDFLAEGYFTRQVIPELLKLETRSENIHYRDPVGTNPLMQGLIEEAVTGVAGVLADWNQGDVSLLIVGHGSTKNKLSKQTLLDHINALRSQTDYAQIADLWLEEASFVSDWKSVAQHKKIIIVPFLLSDGQHGGWDVPEMLGIEGDAVHGVTHMISDYSLRVTPALGTSPRFAEVIEEMV